MPAENDTHIEEPEQAPEKSNGTSEKFDYQAAAKDLEAWGQKHGAVLVAFNPRVKDVSGADVILPPRIEIRPEE